MARQAGFAHVTSTGAVAFHWERRCRVLLRDIRLLGTATFYSLLVRLFTRMEPEAQLVLGLLATS